IPATESINSTGFMFENDVFYLPRNIGFTDDGLLLVYERYEVASYADGPIRLTFPYPEIGRFLKLKETSSTPYDFNDFSRASMAPRCMPSWYTLNKMAASTFRRVMLTLVVYSLYVLHIPLA